MINNNPVLLISLRDCSYEPPRTGLITSGGLFKFLMTAMQLTIDNFMPEYFILFYFIYLFIYFRKIRSGSPKLNISKFWKVHNILIVHIVKSPRIIASQIGIKNHLLLHILAYHKCEFVCGMYYRTLGSVFHIDKTNNNYFFKKN